MSTRAREPRPGTHEQLIAALLPDVTPQRPTPRPVSMPSLPAPSLPSLDDPNTLLVGTARIDRSGRVHEPRRRAMPDRQPVVVEILSPACQARSSGSDLSNHRLSSRHGARERTRATASVPCTSNPAALSPHGAID